MLTTRPIKDSLLRLDIPSCISDWKCVGFTLAIFYALFWHIHFETSQFFEGALIAFFLYSFFKYSSSADKRDPLLITLVLWVLYQFVFVPIVIKQFPRYPIDQIQYAQHYTKIAMIFVVAWALQGSNKKAIIVLYCAAFGFIVSAIFKEGGIISNFDYLIKENRINLGFRNAQHTSVYASFSLMVFLVLWRQFSSFFSEKHRIFIHVATFISAAFCTLVIVTSETRASWLGLSLAMSAGLLILISISIYSLFKENAKTRIKHYWSNPALIGILVLLLVPALVYLSPYGKMIDQRISSANLSSILDGSVIHQQNTAMGKRLLIWKYAKNWFNKRPVFGWGPKTRDYLFLNVYKNKKNVQRQKQFKRIKKRHIGHFHNMYIEIAIAYGLLGLVFYTSIVYLISVAIIRYWKRGLLNEDLFIFSLLFFIYWIIVNISESYLNYSTGTYATALVAGAVYTFKFSDKTQAKKIQN